MPEFNYTARDQSGQMVTGTLTAANRREAAASLAGQMIFPLSVDDAARAVEFSRVRRVPAALLSMAYGQMADLLRSGVPLLRAIERRREADLARRAEVDPGARSTAAWKTAARWPTPWPASRTCWARWP